MADRKTSQEDEAGALTGDELLRIVQDGASRRTTIQAVVILAASSAGGGVPSTLSGAHTAIETETLGVVLSDGAGNTNFINMSLYGSNNAIIYAAALNVYLKAGGNVSVSAPGSVKLQGYGVSIFADEGPISLTPNNATQAVHLQNRVEADGWPTADPAVSNRLWIDGDIVRRSDGSGDPVIATKGALLQAVSTQSIGNTTWTSAQFTTGDGNPALDEDGFYDSGHNTRLTMPRDGWYVITSWHTWAGNNTGQRYARLLLNGTTSLTQDSRIVSASGNDPNVVMSIVHKFSAGDYVELQGWQSSGGSLNLAGAILRIAPLP